MTTITEGEMRLRAIAAGHTTTSPMLADNVVTPADLRVILAEHDRTRAACAIYHATLQAIGYRLGLIAGSDLTVECISAIDRLRAERDTLWQIAKQAVSMLEEVATLNCGPDRALHWWADRGTLRATLDAARKGE